MIDSKVLSSALQSVSAAAVAASAELCAADGALGDGDLGITVSEGFAEAANAALPDDLSNYAHRRDGSTFVGGSFLGRRGGLSRTGLTNAYREINGAADGYPGWFVDRYDKWLYVQQREEGGEVGETRPTASSSTNS